MPDPRHIAIIPDGNRRWAKQRALKPWDGHKAGLTPFKSLIRAALEQNIKCITAWMASRDNLTKRPRQEIDFLYRVFEEMMDHLMEAPEIDACEVRIRAFGDWESFQPKTLVEKIKRLQEKTKHYSKHYLTLLDAYDGITEMTRAVAAIAEAKTKDPALTVTPDLIKQHLLTRDLPPVDLVIRTGGEPHWSGGFMMWDIANAYFYFTETLWPDLSVEEFLRALNAFRARERRHGA